MSTSLQSTAASEPPYTREESLDGARAAGQIFPIASDCENPLSDARDAPSLAVLFDISQLLNTGLDRQTLQVLVGLTESGVNPEALAAVVKELRRESAALEASGAPQPTAATRAAAESAAFAPPRS